MGTRRAHAFQDRCGCPMDLVNAMMLLSVLLSVPSLMMPNVLLAFLGGIAWFIVAGKQQGEPWVQWGYFNCRRLFPLALGSRGTRGLARESAFLSVGRSVLLLARSGATRRSPSSGMD